MEPRTRGPIWEPGAGGGGGGWPKHHNSFNIGLRNCSTNSASFRYFTLTDQSWKKGCGKLTKLSKIDFSMEYFTADIWHARISGLWTQVLDAGLWRLDSGHWTLDAGCWTLDAGLWALDSECRTLDVGVTTLRSGC